MQDSLSSQYCSGRRQSAVHSPDCRKSKPRRHQHADLIGPRLQGLLAGMLAVLRACKPSMVKAPMLFQELFCCMAESSPSVFRTASSASLRSSNSMKAANTRCDAVSCRPSSRKAHICMLAENLTKPCTTHQISVKATQMHSFDIGSSSALVSPGGLRATHTLLR